MFTNKDFLNYFSEIEMMERNMRDIYLEAMEEVEDKRLKKMFEKLYIQETNHQNIVNKIRKIMIKKVMPHGN